MFFIKTHFVNNCNNTCIAARSLHKAASSGPNFLYTTEHNYMDFSVDDNGLWVIYSTADSNNTHIAKVSRYIAFLERHFFMVRYTLHISNASLIFQYRGKSFFLHRMF